MNKFILSGLLLATTSIFTMQPTDYIVPVITSGLAIHAIQQDLATDKYFVEHIAIHPKLAEKYSSLETLLVPTISTIAVAGAVAGYSDEPINIMVFTLCLTNARRTIIYKMIDEFVQKDTEKMNAITTTQKNLHTKLMTEMQAQYNQDETNRWWNNHLYVQNVLQNIYEHQKPTLSERLEKGYNEGLTDLKIMALAHTSLKISEN